MGTSREVEEWIGATPDTRIPPRVALRVIDRAGNCCDQCGNTFSVFLPPEIDHATALVNGGENREATEIFGTPATENEHGWLEAIGDASDNSDPRLTSRARSVVRGIFGE